jgi:hypothetical protein
VLIGPDRNLCKCWANRVELAIYLAWTMDNVLKVHISPKSYFWHSICFLANVS